MPATILYCAAMVVFCSSQRIIALAPNMFIFFSQSPLNLEDYRNGAVRFTIKTNNAGQGLQMLIQDNATVASPSLDLSNYGYNSGAAAVNQTIEVPVADLLTVNHEILICRRSFDRFNCWLAALQLIALPRLAIFAGLILHHKL